MVSCSSSLSLTTTTFITLILSNTHHAALSASHKYMKWKEKFDRIITCKPALAEREMAFNLVFPESLPAFPPACK